MQRDRDQYRASTFTSVGVVLTAAVFGSVLAGFLWSVASGGARTAGTYAGTDATSRHASATGAGYHVGLAATVVVPLLAGAVALWFMDSHASASRSWMPLRTGLLALALAGVGDYLVTQIDPSLGRPIVPVPLVGLSGAYLLTLGFSWLLVYAFTAPATREESAQSG